MEINNIILGDTGEVIKTIQDNTIDLIITSPPYAQKRKDTYGGISADIYATWLFDLSVEFMRVLKPSGSFVLNIKEGTKKGKKEIYVLEYLLKMAKKNWWTETFVWEKTNPFPTGNKKRLKDGFEYCYQFTKTNDYKFFPENCLVPANEKWLKDNLRRKNKGEHLVTNGSGMNMSIRTTNEMVRPSNVLRLASSALNIKHSAMFPIGLPKFFINLMTEKGDIVLDTFMGSGTTALASIEEGRNWIGIEKEKQYVDVSNERIAKLNG
jgi:site-specific DNA-methyltransferase (adenine-specific)